LRSGATTSASVLLVIPNGSQITVTGNLTSGFYPVRYGSTNGFASSTYITFTAPVPSPTPTVPVGGTIIWPVSGGTWEILQGYNGSSHQNTSSTWQYLYSLDIARTDGQTAGTSVFAPVSGTVRWFERSSGGITIDMGNGYAFAMFHLTVDRGWEPGETIQQGDFIGTISPPGGEGFVQVPHIHLTLWQTNDGGNWNRVATPFTGQFTISGNNFPSNGSAFQWSGFEFTP
jgi:murein DD-endopeptidase MepM/ murein hydrolase activator NlpD